jgi:hypothetical protein
MEPINNHNLRPEVFYERMKEKVAEYQAFREYVAKYDPPPDLKGLPEPLGCPLVRLN